MSLKDFIKEFFKDFFKELLAICILTPLLYNFCSADDNDFSFAYQWIRSTQIITWNTTLNRVYVTAKENIRCFQLSDSRITCSILDTTLNRTDVVVCFKNNNSSNSSNISVSCVNSISSNAYLYTYQYSSYSWASCPTCPTCEDMTSLECQTEYNLIPISDVTKNYCELNFDLIDPVNCPSSWGTGDIVRSNVYINNILYPWSSDVYLNVNERLAFDISYNTGFMYVDVYGYEADEDYINGIIEVNSYRPTSEDFTSIFVGGLVRLFPFIVIALFIAFVRKLIRKIFK